ncbi:ammonium transporter [Pseudorhodoplanes sp.]|uniref:ammonium transporter n=1 Tax=Pseudorhodoplanes sp. TaxID=1934341 RepID=UPI00391C1634
MSFKFSKRAGLGFAVAAAVLTAAATAFAQDAKPTPKLDTGDTAWMLTSTALVLMMTIPGIALFYAGMVRKKNILATLMQSFAICCLMSVLWMVCGYSLALTENEGGMNAYIGGLSKIMLSGVTNDSLNGTIPEWVFIMFQMTFAIITPALITGAFAERMKFSAMMWFMGLWLLLVYVPVAHWVWGGGFLATAGVLDFAGGTVVHINAGIAGLVACIMIGKRKGYGTANLAPYNLTYTLIGASLLWVGWFGFNAGSALNASGLTGVAMLNTQVATAAAALAWMFCEWIVIKKPSLLGILSGAIAGLVAITPAAGFVAPGGALVIGIVAGVGCYIAAVHIKKALGYDDSLDVFGVHGVGGIIGALLTGVFASAAINEAGKDASFMLQAYGVIVTIVYTAIVSAIILFVINIVIGLRVTPAQEEEGLDIALHGESIQE